MSLFYEIMVRQRRLYRRLREFFPGVVLNCHEYGVPLSGLEKLVSCPYDGLPDNLKAASDQLEMNRGLAEIIGRKLDRIYSVAEAQYYLDNYEVFEASFAVYRGKLQSVENIIGDLVKNDFVVRHAVSGEGVVGLFCDFKSLDLSDWYCPGHAFRQAVVSIPHDRPDMFAANVNRLLVDYPASAEREYVVNHIPLNEEILPLVRWIA